jgi:DNA-binding response OmpR family regulator
LKIVLEAEGFEYAGAGSAEEGLRVYRKAIPDLIILDLMMEEVDAGTGFAKELQLLANQAPVFMLSSVGDSLNLATDYASLGLAGIFQKPLQKDHLLAVLRAAIPAVEA